MKNLIMPLLASLAVLLAMAARRGSEFGLICPKVFHGANRDWAMTERTPIFDRKRNSSQIGYIEGIEAFDLFGRKLCIYSPATGNLRDSASGRILGHVSLAGKFVGESWIADELFGQPDGEVHTEIRRIEAMPGPPPEEGEPVAAGEPPECSAAALADTAASYEAPCAFAVSSQAPDSVSDQFDSGEPALTLGPIFAPGERNRGGRRHTDMVTIGYARVSTQVQDLTAQLDALKAAGATAIYREKISGARADRPQLAKLMAALKPGDIIVVTKLDRLGRSTRELLDLIDRIGKAGAAFLSLGDPLWDTSSAQGRFRPCLPALPSSNAS